MLAFQPMKIGIIIFWLQSYSSILNVHCYLLFKLYFNFFSSWCYIAYIKEIHLWKTCHYFRIESQSCEDLESIADNPDAIHMEGLCIRFVLVFEITFIGEMFIDIDCVWLILYILEKEWWVKTIQNFLILSFLRKFNFYDWKEICHIFGWFSHC